MSLSSSPSGPPIGGSTYKAEHQNFAKLLVFICNVVTEIFKFIFRKGSAGRLPNEPLLDFYKREGLDVDKTKKKMNSMQSKKVDKDPSGSTFDITLLYFCLRFGHHKLSPGEDNKWYQKDGSTIESLLSIIKNQRNDLAHGPPALSKQELKEMMDGLRDKLIQILEHCRILYSLSNAEVDQKIAEVKDNAEKYITGDFLPESFDEYKKLLIYDVLVDHLFMEGRKELLEHFEKVLELKLTPVNHIAKISPLPLEEIYVQMDMKGRKPNGTLPIPFEDLLLDETGNTGEKTSSVIVVSAPAGLGKTTLTKKLILDWKTQSKDMKYLAEHDFLLKIEFRSRCASSLEELIKYSMPKTSKSYKSDDIKNILLDLKLMIVLDGYDEVNDVSGKLFIEALQLKKKFGFTFLITTRPEKLKDLQEQLKYQCIPMKEIILKGIPSEKKYDLARKYHSEMAKENTGAPAFQGLERHLKKTEYKLADIWRSPYNITVATILFVFRNGDISEFKTAPRLHREIHYLSLEKLLMRLRSNEITQKLTSVECQAIMEHFIYVLARESLVALRDDLINLPLSSFDELVEVCKYNNISVDEMSGAFLHCISSPLDSQKIYGFPHKGLQDFMAALYIHMKLTKGINNNYEVDRFLKGIWSVGNKNNIPTSVIQSVCSCVKKEMNEPISTALESRDSNVLQTIMNTLLGSSQEFSVIEKILAEVNISPKCDMTKYHNVFACLLGMFFLEIATVTDEQKLEVLNFLKRCGINTKEQWFRFLKDTECDPFVASYICQEFNLLEGEVLIEDHSLNAHIALLKAMKTSLRDRGEITLDIKSDLEGFIEVLHLIHDHQLKLKSIVIKDNSLEMTKAFQDPEFPTLDPKVNIDINEPVSLYDACELLAVIKEKNFAIRKLQLKDDDILIDDSNVSIYTKSLASLQEPVKDAFKGCLKVDLSKDYPSLQLLLAHLNRHKFIVTELRLGVMFKNPLFFSYTLKKEIDTLLKLSPECIRCDYMGPATDAVCSLIREPNDARKGLRVSVDDAESLSSFSASVAQKKHHSKYLAVCLCASALSDTIRPLNGCPFVDLIFPDLMEDQLIAIVEIATRLMPTSPYGEFYRICFPRPLCGVSKIIEELPQGLRVRWAIQFPSRLRPKSHRERRMQEEVKKKTGCQCGIEWGGTVGLTGIDIDSW